MPKPLSFFDQVESDLQMSHISPLLLCQYAKIMGATANTPASENVMRMFSNEFHGMVSMLSVAAYHISGSQLSLLADDIKLIRLSVEEATKEIPVSRKDQAYRYVVITAMSSLEKLINNLKTPK